MHPHHGFLIIPERFLFKFFLKNKVGTIKNLKAKDLISKIKAEINTNPCGYFSLTKACIKNKRNLKYMSSRFTKLAGVSFTHYRLNAKLNHAKNLLLTTDKTIDKISEDLGYYNPSSFMKLFKKETGITPSQYRNGKKFSLKRNL